MMQKEKVNWAENIYSFSNKYGDEELLKAYFKEDLQIKLVNYFAKLNLMYDVLDFVYKKSREGKNIMDYALKYNMKNLIIKVLNTYPQFRFENSNNENIILKAAQLGNKAMEDGNKKEATEYFEIVKWALNNGNLYIRRLCYEKEKPSAPANPEENTKSALDYFHKYERNMPRSDDNYYYPKRRREFIQGIDDPQDYYELNWKIFKNTLQKFRNMI